MSTVSNLSEAIRSISENFLENGETLEVAQRIARHPIRLAEVQDRLAGME